MNSSRISELVQKLNECRDAYYNRSDPLIPDSEYDTLFDELKRLEDETGIILSNSPTQTVGYEVKSKLTKVQHDIPLLSLGKTKDENDLKKFAKENPCLLMLKYDGLTVELIYDGGELIQASTRGDGYIGEDITHNAKTFKNIPLNIPYKGFLRVVGEAIIHEGDFRAINNNLPAGEKPYANARNLAAGSVRQLDSGICAERNIAWMLWDVLEGFEELGSIRGNDSRFYKINRFYGTLAEDSQMRRDAYLKTGCNAFKDGHGKSTPMGFWTRQDILRYLHDFNIPIAPPYGEIIKLENGKFEFTKEHNTGCKLCLFGCHLEKEPNRIQRLANIEPNTYKFVMKSREEGGLGYREVMDYLGIPYENKGDT